MASWLPIAGAALGGVAGGVLGGPVGAGVGVSAGSALGGWLDGAYDTPGAIDPYQVDPAYYDTGAYDSISETAKAKAKAAALRDGPEADWAMSNADRGLALEARGRQMRVADDLEAFLRGERDSLAEQQLRSGLRRVQAGAQNAAANVRGGAGNQLAAAENAQRTGAIAALDVNRQMGEQRAAEEASSRAQLAQLLGQARGQDLSMRGQSQGQAQFDVQAAQANQAANDAMERFYQDLNLKAAQGASQAKQAQGAAQQSAAGQVTGINAAREQQAQDRQAELVAGLGQAGSGIAQVGMQSTSKQPAATPAPAPPPTPAPQGAWAGAGLGSDVVDPWGKPKKPGDLY